MTSSLMMRSEPSSVVRSLLQMTYFFVKLLNLLKRVLVSLSSAPVLQLVEEGTYLLAHPACLSEGVIGAAQWFLQNVSVSAKVVNATCATH